MKRNIVFIICDSLRPDFISPYGCDFIPTPNIEKLAAEGVTFENSIAASTVCAPSRASIDTGKTVSSHDYWTNNMSFKDGTEFLSDRLNDLNYLTAAVGSYDNASYKDMYQYFCPFDENRPGSVYLSQLKEKHPEAVSYAMNNGYHFKYTEAEHYDRWTCDRATEFIDSYSSRGEAPNGIKAADRPFFLYCGFLMPHGPYIPPREVEGTVDISKIPEPMILERGDEDIPSVEKYRRAYINTHQALTDPKSVITERMKKRAAYCEMIVEIDNLVGRIAHSLKMNGLYENTTIIFTSDHGSMEDDYNLDTKGPFPYRPQLFVPLIVSNDPRIKAGSRSDCLCGNLDIGATILDIAGSSKPFGISRSLIGMADGSFPEREVNISEFCDSCKNLVDKRYTFSYYPFTGTTTLFDRISDPHETVNLSGKSEYSDIIRRFLMHLVDFMVLAKGVRIEAHDLTPDVKSGIEAKHPCFLDSFDIAYPLPNMESIERLKSAGLSYDYNEFCKTREIKAHYGVYFKK